MLDWLPKSFVAWRGYQRVTFIADLIAGITVGLVALPLAMAFAISSGMRPEAGIYTAIVAGAITSIFGGTRTQVSGPTGAFVVVVAGIVASHGIDGLFTVTLLAGLMLIILGATGLGTAVKYIPRPVVVGFTNGIAILIASTQIKDFFGLTLAKTPGPFLERMVALWDAKGTFDLTTFAVSAGSLIALILMVRYVKKVPGAIVALLAATVVVSLAHLHVDTIGTRFGGIPQGLPRFQIPTLHVNLIPGLLGPAITVAMLGAIESLMSAVVADRMTRDKHQPECGTHRPGSGQSREPTRRGPACDRRDRPNRDEHPVRCQDADVGGDPRDYPFSRLVVRGTLGGQDPPRGAFRHPADGLVQHGRVA